MSQIHAASSSRNGLHVYVLDLPTQFLFKMNFLAQVYLSKWQVAEILRGKNHFTHLSCSACCFCITSTHRKRPEATDADLPSLFV